MYHKISQEEKSSNTLWPSNMSSWKLSHSHFLWSSHSGWWFRTSFMFHFIKKGCHPSHWLVQLTPMTSSWERVCYVYIRDIPVSMPWGFLTIYPPFTHDTGISRPSSWFSDDLWASGSRTWPGQKLACARRSGWGQHPRCIYDYIYIYYN